VLVVTSGTSRRNGAGDCSPALAPLAAPLVILHPARSEAWQLKLGKFEGSDLEAADAPS
jgi:hypothetical protein